MEINFVGIFGAGGKMGREIIANLKGSGAELSGAYERDPSSISDLGSAVKTSIEELFASSDVVIDFSVAKATLPLPKSVHKEWILENSKLIKLTDDDIEAISAMKGLFFSGMNPDEVDF